MLGIDDTGHGFCRILLADGSSTQVTLLTTLRERTWTRLWAAIDTDTGRLTVGSHSERQGETNTTTLETQVADNTVGEGEILIAATRAEGRSCHFNGKIDSPMIYDRYLDQLSLIHI